jgi:4-hydroxy-3-polyprenylbenzoate decarboxylase
MGYRSLQQCVADLERAGHLLRCDEPVDACLEAAEIHRRVYRSGGPAILFTKVKDCQFPMVSNLFGTIERARFIFRDTIEDVKRAVQLKVDPTLALRHPLKYWRAPILAWQMQPKSVRRGAVLSHQTSIDRLPPLTSWPDDGGAFITLPQVYSEDVRNPGLRKSNLGMYRVQISGNQYQLNREIGLHYQIHRGIGVHHQAALEANKPFRVNIFVGGNPAMTVSAVMPLPEGMSELTFAGALAGHRIPMVRQTDYPAIYADADFCIVGTIDPERLLPEGPFGDHLGYYSLAHEFPVLKIEKVYHRPNAIWPFTVVGRPPQEDSVFGELIHELTGPVIPTVLPGVKAVNAVDAAGVHPLLLALGSERYVPYRSTTEPAELLTQANAILGQGQMSLAKYLMIMDQACDPQLDIHDIEIFVQRVLERVDWRRDLHFQTKTTIDTLDYSGSGFNTGSKVVIAAVGPAIRQLGREIPASLQLPPEFGKPKICLPGILAVEAPSFTQSTYAGERPSATEPALARFCRSFSDDAIEGFPFIVIVDDSEFTARSLNNFLWVVFTRSNPATDISGIGEMTEFKHWGCRGSLVIDARIKPHHAPPLIEAPAVTSRIDAMAARGGAVARWL